jgi:protein-S-isoprenylcysteine O-methyltransferase Ste14
MSEPAAPRPPTVIGIKLFGRTLAFTGWAAKVFIVLLLLGIAALCIRYLSVMSYALWISAALWIVMMVYWSAAAKQSAPVKSGESAASRSRHQLLLNVALLLAFIRLPGTGFRWLPVSRLVAPIGLAVQAGAMLLDVWAMRCLGRNWSGAVAIKVDQELIKTGPYRLVRHPIYTAMLGMYLGTAIVSGELHGLIAVALACFAYWRKTRMEERGLIEVFGPAYEAYRRESWALVPFVF